MLGTFAALLVVAKIALRLPLKMPGHSGIFSMAVLIVARTVVARRGAATITGLLAGTLATFAGIGDRGALVTLLSQTAAGMGIDAAWALTGGSARAWASALAGLIGNFATLGVKIALDLWIGIPTGFVLLGWLYPALTYSGFGVAGGYLGFVVVQALRRGGYFAYLAERR